MRSSAPRLCCVCGCWMPMPEAATRKPGAARLWRARERVLPRGGPRGLSLTSRLGRASARHPSAALPSARRTRKATPVKQKEKKKLAPKPERRKKRQAMCFRCGGMKPCRNPLLCKAQSHPCPSLVQFMRLSPLLLVESRNRVVGTHNHVPHTSSHSSRTSKMMTRCP